MAFGIGSGIGALGSGAMSGIGTGMDLRDKYETMQGQNILMGSISDLLPGMAAMGNMPPPGGSGPQGGIGPQPGVSSAPMPPIGAPGPPQGPGGPGQMAGPGPQAAPIMPAAMQPGSASAGPGPMRPMAPPMPGTYYPPGGAPPQVTPQRPPQQPPQPPQPPPSREDQMGATRFAQTGQGWLSAQDLARRINDKYPDASPMAKFKAMEMGMKLLNQGGQQQFNQMMQMMQYRQREEHFQKGEQHKEAMEQRADERSQRAQEGLDIRERSQLRNSPYVRGEEKQVTAAKTNLTNTELRMDKIKGHLDALIPVAAKVGITGNMKFDTWLQEARSKLGWTDETYAQYQLMLNNLRSEIAAMSQQTLGSLTVSAREDAKQLANGVLTPGILKSMGAALAIEGRVTKEATKNIVSKHQKNIDQYMRSKGEIPDEPEEAAAPAAAPAGAGAANDPLGIR